MCTIDCAESQGDENYKRMSTRKSPDRGRGAPKSRAETTAIQLKKLVKNMTQAKRDALKKQTEREKEKVAIDVRAFLDEHGQVRAGQVLERLEYLFIHILKC